MLTDGGDDARTIEVERASDEQHAALYELLVESLPIDDEDVIRDE